MENIFEGIILGTLRIVWFFIYNFLFGTLCYFIGWPVCKFFTLGRYPYKYQKPYFEYTWHQEGWPCSLVGLITLVVVFIILIKVVA